MSEPQAYSQSPGTRPGSTTVNSTPSSHNPSELLKTQDLPPMLEENSNMYAFSRSGFFQRETRITPDPMLWEMDPLEAIDIDEEHDFRLAEMVYAGPDSPT